MNMQKIMLEALTFSTEQINRDTGRSLAKLLAYEFPIDRAKVGSQKIVDRIDNEKKPVTFEWAFNEYKKNKGDYRFLYDLGNSLAPKLTKTSLFFGHQESRPQWPYLSAMREGPAIFDYFGDVMGRDVWERSANAVSHKFDKEGNITSSVVDNSRGIIASATPYYRSLNDKLERAFTSMTRSREVRGKKDANTKDAYFKKAVLCGAYIKYMFDVVKDAEKVYSDSDASTQKIDASEGVLNAATNLNSKYDELKDLTEKLDALKSADLTTMDAATKQEVESNIAALNQSIAGTRKEIDKFEKGAGSDSHTIARKTLRQIPMDDTGSLDNWGSVYNMGDDTKLQVIDPSEINAGNLSELRVYPQYVIDVLRLRIGDDKSNNVDRLIGILKGTKYAPLVDVLEHIGTFGGKDNRILPISTTLLLEMLNDDEIIRRCFDYDIGDIFDKGGKSWVSVTLATGGKSVVDNRLNKLVNFTKTVKKPKKNAKRKGAPTATVTTHIHGVAKPQETNADLRNARVVPVVVGQSLKNSNTERENTGNGVVAQTHKDMVIADAVATKKGDSGYTEVTFTTRDTGSKHTLTLTPDVTNRLNSSKYENVFKNVIARKVEGGGDGHEYYLSIPFGMAFVAMQDDEGNIVRNENMDTLCQGLLLRGHPTRYASVQRLINSPIGKYCHAVATLGKVGRVRFSTSEANKAYTTVLIALQNMKANGQKFSPELSNNKYKAISSLEAPVAELVKVKNTNISPETAKEEAKKILAPLSAIGVTMRVEKYNARSGHFEFKQALNMYIILLKHLVDMYNLNSIKGYTRNTVARILEAVAPDVWNLTEWNYANVLRADKVLNGPSVEADDELGLADESAVDVNSIPDENGFDAENGGESAIPTGNESEYNEDGEPIEGHQDEFGAAPEDSGLEADSVLDDAVNQVRRELFVQHGITPVTKHDAECMQRGILEKISELQKTNELNLPGIEQAVAGITDYTDYNDFMKKFGEIESKLIANMHADTDDSIDMAFFAESGKSTTWVVNVVQNVLSLRMPDSVSDEDAELIPEIGGMMTKFALLKSGNTGDMTSKFDTEYLTSVFDETFIHEFEALTEHLADLTDKKSKLGVMTIDEDLDREYSITNDKANLYQKIEQKIDNDPQYISMVADLIVQNAAEIKKLIRGVNRSAEAPSNTFVAFRPDTATKYDGPGMAIIDFCTYNFETRKEKADINRLSYAFGDATVGYMMDSLVNSVPRECISVDSIKDEKSIEDLDDNQRSALMSYYEKSGLYDATRTSQIKDIYLNRTMDGIFDVDESKGQKSPYTYKGTGKQINLHLVKPFFDYLMKIADSYNIIGYNNSTKRGIKHTQVTYNNEEQDKHVLYNKYFIDLKTAFDNVYNRYVSGEPFTAKDKKVMDLVSRDVLSNPMNVLINNNVKLVTAYVYHVAGLDKTHKAEYQSNQTMGFGSGEITDTTLKGLDSKSALNGLNHQFDTKRAVLRLSELLNQSEQFVTEILPVAQKKVGDSANAVNDYASYLEYIRDDGSHVRGLLNKVYNAEPVGKETEVAARKRELQNIFDNSTVFCNYGINDNTKEAEKKRIIDLRIAELIVLLANTAHEIWEPIPMSSTEKIVGAVNANSDILNSKYMKEADAVIPDELANRFNNIDAELRLAAPETRNMLYGYNKSNNNPAEVSTKIMDERTVPQNLSNEIINMFISETPIDDDKLSEAIKASGLEGDDRVGSQFSTGGKCDVTRDSTGMRISSNIILNVGDVIVFKHGNVRRASSVISVLDQKNKIYEVTSPDGMPSQAKDVPFYRFQLRNGFEGGDTERKADAVINKLIEWCDRYEPSNTPDDIMFKALCLKNIYSGSACAKIIKALISYYIWKLSGYSWDLVPKMDLRGDKVGGQYFTQLKNVIVADLKYYGRTNKVMRDKIEEVAVKCGLMNVIHNEDNLSSNIEKRKTAAEDSSLVTMTAWESNARRTLDTLVNSIGEHTGFVSLDEVNNTIERMMSTQEGAEKLKNLVGGDYKDILETVLRKYNWAVAQPLVEAYKRSAVDFGDTPTVDGAIQYIKDNYVERSGMDASGVKVTRNDKNAFVQYVEENFVPDIQYALRQK